MEARDPMDTPDPTRLPNPARKWEVRVRLLPAMLALFLAVISASVIAQGTPLESRVSKLEREVSDKSTGALVFLFGAFCALWAQNTGRSAWLWFFLGAFFSVIAVLVLLVKNSGERRRTAAQPMR